MWAEKCRDGASASWPLLSVWVWDNRQGPDLLTPRRVPETPPPADCGLLFLGDTSIRRCVRVTNLLQAGQLSQGSLIRRAGKADTLGECWQASARAAVGSWAFRLLFLGTEQTQVRQTWVQVPVLLLTGLVTWAYIGAFLALIRVPFLPHLTLVPSSWPERKDPPLHYVWGTQASPSGGPGFRHWLPID